MPVTRAFAIACLVSALTLAGAGAATAGPSVSCGDTITADTTLTRNLSCPDGNGLVLADGATLNLGGHRLRGPGVDVAGSGNQIAVSLPLDGTATVVNGTITNWTLGIGGNDDLGGQQTGSLRDLRLLDNGTGIAAFAADFTVERSVIAGSRYNGLTAYFARRLTVSDSVLRNNTYAAAASSSGLLSLTRTRLIDNENGINCSESNCELIDSRLSGSEHALVSFGSGLTVTGSAIVDSTVAYEAQFTSSDTLVGNRFARNDIAVKIQILAGAEIRDNTFTANRVAYTLAHDEVEQYQVTLTANTFTRNGDAIYAVNPGTSIGHNIVERNTGWGIYAPGATDLGGNVSRRNGNQPQCVGVTC